MREFIDKGHYFILRERSAPIRVSYDQETKKVVYDGERGWVKTHLIIQKSATPPHDVGLQIIRFEGETERTANNPYAGIYLTKPEWETVFNRMGSL
jgi:hypothetical protein